MKALAKPVTEISLPVESMAIASAVAALLLLASLHVLSPEFDPAWRMVSEYANGQYGWVLSLMFIAWAVSSWALAFAIRLQVRTTAGRIGLIFLIAAGIGEAIASVFEVTHPLHGLAAMIGIPSLPVAAMLISVGLSRTQEWSSVRKSLLWTANLTWISILLLVVTFAIMIVTYTQTGATMDPQAEVTVLPVGVIAFVGWANRFLIVVYCVWVMTVAQHALKLRNHEA